MPITVNENIVRTLNVYTNKTFCQKHSMAYRK